MRFVAIAVLVFLASAPIAAAQVVQAPGTPILGTVLSIDANGKSTGRPDQAMISVGVITEAPNAADAMSQNAQQMSALMLALRNAGVAERDILTSNISVQPQQVYH